MILTISSPIKAFVQATSEELEILNKFLTYTNLAAQHELKRFQQNHWAKTRDPNAFNAHVNELKAAVKNTLIFEENGQKFIRPGSIPYLPKNLTIQVINEIQYPTPKKIAWEKPLKFTLYPYQNEGVEKLIAEKHGNVVFCTGSGKTACIVSLCRETGFKTAIIAPSKSIFNELIEIFEFHFGKGKIGKFGDGKKVLGKQFTICISDSITNIKPESKEWEFFSTLEMIACDEAHSLASETLEQMCNGVLGEIPYRFFFTATPTRGDGTLKLLQSVIGNTVHTLSTQDAVEQGYICPHKFKIVQIDSTNPNYYSTNVLDQKRVHVLKNRNIATFIAKVANADAVQNGKQTLVLVEELSQIAMIIPLLKVPYVIAHSESSKAKLESMGLIKVNTKESIESFNKNEAKVLIGTSAVHVGVNIFPTHNTFNWIGGASEVKTLQSVVGRSVRFLSASPWATSCVQKPYAVVWDFDVRQDVMHKHLETRLTYYAKSGSTIEFINL